MSRSWRSLSGTPSSEERLDPPWRRPRELSSSTHGRLACCERLAYIQIQGGDWGGAVRAARESLSLDPFRRFARMFLIQSLLHQGDLEPAQEEFRTLSRLFPSERESLDRWFAEKKRKRGD